MASLDPPPQNVTELLKRLTSLDIHVSKSTIWRWVDKGLIPAPKSPRGKGRGKGSTSVWNNHAIRDIAGVWALRGGSMQSWSAKMMNDKTIRQVQQFAGKIYSCPYVVLSIPDDTEEDYDPPVQDVFCSVGIYCPPRIEPLITRYVVATQKACRGWRLNKPAVLTFRWSGSVRKSRERFERTLYGISLSETRHDDKLCFIVGGQDVRMWLLQDRALMRALRARDASGFEKQGLRIETTIRRPLASDPIAIRDEDDTFDKVYSRYRVRHERKGNKLQVDRRFKHKWNFKEPPTVARSEFYVRLHFAAHKESGDPFKIRRAN